VTVGAASAGLRRRILRGSFFEMGGYGAQQLIRFASNLILTRWLYPSAFGQATIVYTISSGLFMLTDIAFQPVVVQSKRGDDPAFLNTAWTMLVLRGFALSALMFLLAWPAAWFYREPGLVTLVHIGSLQFVIQGFHSTSIFTMRRKLQLGWTNGLDLATSVASTLCVLLLVHAHRTPSSLIAGTLMGVAMGMITSHFLPVGYRNRFHWDKEAVQEIRTFGRWVLGSSAATFLGAQSDRILLGRFLGTAWLGVYGIAVNLSEMLSVVVSRVITGVIYPALSEHARTAPEDVPRFFYRLRLRLDALSMTATGLLAGTGGWIVRTLWDPRYANAAWIVQILSIRVAVNLMVGPSESCLFALGHTRVLFGRSVARLAANVIAIPLGWYLGGVEGVIWGTALAEIPTILAVWPKSHSLRIFRLGRELIAVAIFVAAFLLGRVISSALPVIHLR
jgi:O-antigen/teichoic acid export membrane protein